VICGFDRQNWRGWVEWELMSKEYAAPWGWSLRIVSVLATVVCGVGAGLMWWSDPLWVRWLAWLPLVVIVGSVLFLIRGYSVTSEEMGVRRLFWCTRVSLAELISARVESGAMRWSVRLCGNGGFFSITGYYFNRSLGRYRAWVTDADRVVVLRFPSRTVVISPAEPEEFILDLQRYVKKDLHRAETMSGEQGEQGE
jgi:hypothetical protein